tara:strand:+ start:1373 stop:1489 length:117 start_codon:yes stop_codon:yes gene_type:complete
MFKLNQTVQQNGKTVKSRGQQMARGNPIFFIKKLKREL